MQRDLETSSSSSALCSGFGCQEEGAEVTVLGLLDGFFFLEFR